MIPYPESIERERTLKPVISAGDNLAGPTRADGGLRDCRPCWQIVRIPFGRAAIHPIRDQIEVFLSKRLLISKTSKTLHRAPGGHSALKGFFLDRVRPGIRLLVTQERKCAATWTVARRAACIDNPRDFAVPCHMGRDVVGARHQASCHDDDAGESRELGFR